MRSGVLAQKVGMTRVFTDTGEHIPVTVLKLGNCQVVAHRTKERNGYVALQLGAGSRKVKNVSKAERGRYAVAKVEPKAKLVEFRVSDDAVIPVGAEITADHMGVDRITTLNLKVVQLDVDRGLILVEGAVPGSKGGWITVRDAVKKALPKDAPKPGKFRETGGSAQAAPAEQAAPAVETAEPAPEASNGEGA